MKDNQPITVRSVNLCDLCVSVLKRIVFNTETQSTQSITEKISFFYNNE